MTIISNGYSGTLNASTWAQGESYSDPSVKSSTALVVSAVGGVRAVSVAAGESYSSGIRVTVDAASQVSLSTPAQGQYFLIVARRDWTTGLSSLVALPGPTTTTTTPTSAPTTVPIGLEITPGVREDQPLAWAWCNFSSTSVTLWDTRVITGYGLPLVASTAGLYLLRGQYSGQLAAVAADGQIYRLGAGVWAAWTTGVGISDVSGLQAALDAKATVTAVNAKADSSALTTTNNNLTTTNTNVSNLTTTVNGHTTSIAAKADSSALSTTNTNVSNLTTTVNGHTTTIATKANQSSLDTTNTNVTNLTSTVSGHTTKLNNYKPAKITVQTAATADPTTGNTTGDLLIEY